MKDFQELVEWVREGRYSSVDYSSERRHLFEFLSDVADGVVYDLRGGNYSEVEAEEVLRQQLIGSLQEIVQRAENMLAELEA